MEALPDNPIANDKIVRIASSTSNHDSIDSTSEDVFYDVDSADSPNNQPKSSVFY